MMRHLSQLTYKLLYTQDPLAEFDFSLVSMSADLKDGLRLCKLAEALTGDTLTQLFPLIMSHALRQPHVCVTTLGMTCERTWNSCCVRAVCVHTV